uniref:Methionine sulfoxide reductase B1b n=1 Tax=Echeneis naucrates TaxID=173247 RepID=A0A665WS70_ECHNA
KTDVRSFPDRKHVGTDRFTFGFTIRDSLDFFMNVTAWGNSSYINGLSNSFTIGDCVTIENPLVANKDPERGDRFCPTTPSCHRLLVTEAHSQVSLCADMDITDRLLPLIHLPVKDSRDFYSLSDIEANGQQLDGKVINILAAVRLIGEPKQFTTSDGRKGQRLEVKLFDDSVSSFPLVWDREVIQLVQTWIPKETVVFIADAKISFDSFRSGMAATVNSKSIITVNPDTREASLLNTSNKSNLKLYSFCFPRKETYRCGVTSISAVDSISNVYTVSQLKQKARDNSETFFGITYSFISKLDLDSSVSRVIRTQCSRCKFQANEDAQSCPNQLCPGKDQALSATTGFYLLVDFTDHTGTLQACTLRSPVAENTLGCTVSAHLQKDYPSGVILACSLADPGEVKQQMSSLL